VTGTVAYKKVMVQNNSKDSVRSWLRQKSFHLGDSVAYVLHTNL